MHTSIRYVNKARGYLNSARTHNLLLLKEKENDQTLM